MFHYFLLLHMKKSQCFLKFKNLEGIIIINILNSQIFPLLSFVAQRYFKANGRDIIKMALDTGVLLATAVNFKPA